MKWMHLECQECMNKFEQNFCTIELITVECLSLSFFLGAITKSVSYKLETN